MRIDKASEEPDAETIARIKRQWASLYKGPSNRVARLFGGSMKLVPVGDRIVVKRIESSDKTPGGIVIPDVAKERPKIGKIIAVGDGPMIDGKKVALDFREGQTVMFTSYAGNEVKVDGDELLILKSEEILALVS